MKGVKEFFNSKCYAYTVDLRNNLEVNPALIDSLKDNLIHRFDEEYTSIPYHTITILAGYMKYRYIILGGKKNG
tara:strand:+ start:603 stop:824 length:222 start_codon:yes stop_codon:yes gene_type:complete